MHKKFDNQAIEKKWQATWKESGIYNVGERDLTKEKEYILVEWPYPSGNLHIGHWHAFAVPDIYVRFKRMHGKQVLYPMGFDAFGLPAENAAIKKNVDPKGWTEGNIAFMRTQLESMGASFSWDKTTSSTDQDYYKWTQWMFTQFFEKGIAYRGKGVVNWCPGCNTVIANEQVLANGTCERSGDVIEKKEMPQWMLSITKYADRLVDDLDELAWPEQIKDAQRNWIGRKRGAEIPFTLSTGDTVTVFTTRPDTLFGATFLVLAPEHPLIEKVRVQISNFEEVSEYVTKSKQKEEKDRLDATKEKTGVCLEGITATNPANGKQIPVFVADYVLGGYGTGALMAVPAHDERDFAFAQKFGLPITYVVKPKDTVMQIQEDGKQLFFDDSGELISSNEFSGMDSEEAGEKIVEKVGGKMTSTYRLRDWSIGRQRYWGVPIPIVYDPQGVAHVVPKEHLPWVLPEDVDFRPTGVAPLAKSEELKKRTVEIFGEGWTPEVETMDTFVDSSWYFLRYLDNTNDDVVSSLERQKEWMPIDMYFGGAEHTTMHLLYSRFWQKALFDLGLVTESEPYKHRINRGLILGPDGNKMSKSKGNVIDPDEHVKTVGADTVKMYLAFMGPYGETANYPWDMGGIAGIRRFLERVYGLGEHITDNETENITKLLHKTIEKVSIDVPQYKFNTAISAMMIFLNGTEKEGLSKESYTTFLRLLAPFAPHLTEELWSDLGHTTSIHIETFPVADKKLTQDDTVNLAVQINGKMRGTILVSANAEESEVVSLVTKSEQFKKYVEGEVRKVIYVPKKIINCIVS
ncbi:MAG: leucyl-tRNA synthetase [Candidatus Parcubacteria bacterium]|jgi:leucyl-tRNA synthetase